MTEDKRGILIGVGVGPGDPELMTLKAIRMIKEADRVILPQREAREARAYQIALGAVPSLADKCLIGLHFPMTRDRDARDRQIAANYALLRPYLQANKRLVFLTIGDPCLYSTFCHLKACAEADACKTEMVNGISSFAAASARWNIPLCLDDEELHLLNGKSRLKEGLALPGTKVLMKAGSCLFDLAEALQEHPDMKVYGVKDCGLPGEEVYDQVKDIPGDYMLTVILKEEKGSG